VKALCKAQMEFKAIKKSGVMEMRDHRYRYSTWTDICDALYPALHKNGIVFMPLQGRQGDTFVMMGMLLHGESGQWVSSTAPIRDVIADNLGIRGDSQSFEIATTYAYPAKVADRYVFDPSPIPKFDNPKLDDCPALQLFGAGREKRIYAVPPYTKVKSLDFEDHPFEVQRWSEPCALCGSTASFLDEIVMDDKGKRMFVCSDTDFCATRRGEA
jgi:hypothetical protein